MSRAGICGTDLALAAGLYRFRGVPGHEFVGTVDAGPDTLLGRRVVGEINVSCGTCPWCRRGEGKHCPERTALGIRGRDGAFAEWVALPAANLHPVPDSVSDDAATFCEPLAAALESLDASGAGPGTRVLVVGAGRLGQLVCRVMAEAGSRVTVLGRHSRQRARVPDGIEWTASPSGVLERAFDVVVECTGNADGLALALEAVRARGTIVLKSTYPGSTALDAGRIVVDEIRITGSRCGPFPRALDMLASGRVETDSLVDGHFPLAEGADAFARAARPGALKVMLDIDAER